MKNYSYPYLISITIGTLGIIFVVLTWKYEIEKVTFVYSQIQTYIVYTSLALSVAIFLFFMKAVRAKIKTKREFLKIYAGLFIGPFLLCFLTLYFITTTLIFILPGKYEHYTTRYQYSEKSGRGSCSGAQLNDPVYGEIKVCHPAGAYHYDSKIYIEKRINALGFVVTYARTSS